MIRAGIIGGTGYTGVELIRILTHHPDVELACITSRSESGNAVSDLFPSVRGINDLVYVDPESADLSQCDVVFSAAPNGVAMSHARELLDSDVKIVDLSADFRLKDISIWEKWYGMEHSCPELVESAVYGLPELFRDKIADATLVANPGCYPTAVQLGFLPLIRHNLVYPETLIADAKSGVSGAGRKASLTSGYSEVSESFKAYAASGHRHLPEITQGLNWMGDKENPDLVFVPHLVPMVRGIHATLYATLNNSTGNCTLESLQSLYEETFANEIFVDVMPLGSHPDTRSVRGSNQCRLAIHRPDNGSRVVVLAVEDNLVKGAAGQAVQNMNIMFGLKESSGLSHVALVP